MIIVSEIEIFEKPLWRNLISDTSFKFIYTDSVFITITMSISSGSPYFDYALNAVKQEVQKTGTQAAQTRWIAHILLIGQARRRRFWARFVSGLKISISRMNTGLCRPLNWKRMPRFDRPKASNTWTVHVGLQNLYMKAHRAHARDVLP